MEYSKKYMDKKNTLRKIIEKVSRDIEEHGIDVISDKISGHSGRFRSLELAFVLNRLRGFDIINKQESVE